MSYLIAKDLSRAIQSDNLSQIIGGDVSISAAAQLTAQEEAITFLSQKYDTASEFTDTNVWDPLVIYKAADRVYLDAAAYDSSKTYALTAMALYNGSVYRCTTAVTAPETFAPGKWASLGKQYDIFFAKYPVVVFNIQAGYQVGEVVYWKGKKYSARTKTNFLGHDAALQFGSTDNIPYPNYFPDDVVNGTKQWTSLGAYTVAAGTLPTNTTYWVAGDNRSQAMVMYIIDIALYHLHSRIAPRNIPDLRVKRYDDAIANLKGYAKGTTTANLTRIQPPQGNRIRWGSGIKNVNNY